MGLLLLLGATMVNSVGMTVVCYRCFVLLCLFCSVGTRFAFCGLTGVLCWLVDCFIVVDALLRLFWLL